MVALKLIKIFDMENEKQRDSCLKEVQLHQVSPKEKIAKLSALHQTLVPNRICNLIQLVFRPSVHREIPQLVHRQQVE